ncbi:hypothetical protein C6T52_19890 [Burkholderia multivorans]|nr:hypothetical protein C6T62_25625 [Burkholderia multivorans]PRG34038.1 hypothetical protein C6T52_19890 [Burkholderia multivorans]
MQFLSLRELIIPFGAFGYVALFEIDYSRTVTILAVRPQRERDYHCRRRPHDVQGQRHLVSA